ncbi:hypothetical protein ACTWPT_58530 [Nonomuraea sp. 3N208]|uniref:hypothetical protein n=1 Tax=Nonomuraea sp. 3N208 TaxID=3457421 RepID=UPI003FD13E63
MEYFIVTLVAVMLVVLVWASFSADAVGRVLPVLMAAFVARLLIHLLLTRSDALGYGGDHLTFEERAAEIVALWELEGVQFVTSEQIPFLFSVALPCNLFAFIMWLCGGEAPFACTAVVAFIASALCIIVYKAAILIGADARAAFRLLVITAFLPSFLLHTSDMYKDGINAFLVLACMYLTLSILHRFAFCKMFLIGLVFLALWHVRLYMVFMCAVPVMFGFLTLNRKFPFARVMVVFAFGVTALLACGGVNEILSGTPLQEQLDFAHARQALDSNSSGGSGVSFDDGGNPWGAIVPKLLYALLSPFLWMDGSLELQLGKIEVAFWYYLLCCAAIGARKLWNVNRIILLLLLLLIVPGFIAYATTMANVGLILRQRMPLVMVTSLISAVAWTRNSGKQDTSKHSSGLKIGYGVSVVLLVG